jgi:hypothetical protein
LEGFANIYGSFAAAIRGEAQIPCAFPTVEDGARGVRFIEAVLSSAKGGGSVVEFEDGFPPAL